MQLRPLSDDVVSKRRDELKVLLERMSSNYITDTHEFDILIEKFDEIYSDEYRQMYSELYPMISGSLDKHDIDESCPLIDNFEMLRNYIKEKMLIDKKMEEKLEHLYGKILKLSDHVNLEIQRHNHRKVLIEETAKAKKENDKLRDDLKRTKKKIKRLQTEFIVILGIFAAIVMAFSGGITLLGSSLEGMVGTNPYKIAFVILLCGIILFNVMAMLMEYIYRVVNDLESSINNRRPWFVIAVNLLLIFMFIIVVCLWSTSDIPFI